MPSTAISHFRYNEESKILEITFITGLVYQYIDVPPKTYKMLKAAGSKGRYFNYYIKDKFEFQKIETE